MPTANPPLSLALFALRRSRARREVLQHLGGGADYPAAIARSTGLGVPAALGALRGLGLRYHPDRSLLGLQLIREVERPAAGCRLYELTPLGRRLLVELAGGERPRED